MRLPNSLQGYYEETCKQICQLLNKDCRSVAQRAAVSVMVLARCEMQLAFLAEHLPKLDGLSFYSKILDDMERFVCDGDIIDGKTTREYECWCLRMGKLAEEQHISLYSPWRLRLLPGFLEQLGAFFSHGAPLLWEDVQPALLGVWLLFWYEVNYGSSSPKDFNFYQFIRATHPEIEQIGRERDALRKKLEKSVTYHEAYEAISETYIRECQKYWSEAAAEKKRLTENVRPMTADQLIRTPAELERVRSDIRFAAAEDTSREKLRQRLRMYRGLDITKG